MLKSLTFLNVRGFLEEIVPYTIVCFSFYTLEKLNLWTDIKGLTSVIFLRMQDKG